VAKKPRSDIEATPEQLMFIEWLKRQAAKVGDKLPHGDGLFSKNPTKFEIRLPYPNKSVVWNQFKNFWELQNVTSRDCHSFVPTVSSSMEARTFAISH
jgi:hypothetical protein